MSTFNSWKTAGQTVDLTNCDREPIHLIGGVQPHGCLLVVQFPSGKILQASENCVSFMDLPASALLGRSISGWINPRDTQRLGDQLQASIDSKEVKPLKLSLQLSGGVRDYTVSIHPLPEVSIEASIAVLEFETSLQSEPLLSFVEFYDQFTSSIFRIQQAASLHDLCESAVEEVRSITGFDRVWIHRVVEGGHLKVIAERKRDDQDAFLGLHFPESDIPKQARRLFALNRLRLITEVKAPSSPIVPEFNPVTGDRLDLSKCFLRAVSPVHVEYLSNIQVEASMSISLVKDGELWGLISCHHDSPHELDYQKRAACEFIGRIISLQIPGLETKIKTEAELRLRVHLLDVLKLLSAPDVRTLLQGIKSQEEDFLAMVEAEGAAFCLRNEPPLLLGKTPPREAISELVNHVMNQSEQPVYATDEIARIFPHAADWASQASGMLGVSLTPDEKYVVIWFRSEQMQTIPWGADPRKSAKNLASGEKLTPRKSFELWDEIVRGKSTPWKASEKQIALEFRQAFMMLIADRAKEMFRLNQELERSNQELDSFAYVASHDLKEPLRGIHTYATFLIEDYADKLDEDGKHKLSRLMTMTGRMNALIESLLRLSRVGRIDLELQPTPLREAVEEACDSLRTCLTDTHANVTILGELPTLVCDRIQITEVFHNLIVNATKYNEIEKKTIEIGTVQQGGGPESAECPVFFVRDNGIGIDLKHRDLVFQIFKRLHAQDKYGGGSGAGLTIVRKIIERHGGKIWFDSSLGHGTTFYFTLRSGHLTNHPSNPADAPPPLTRIS
ncbi:MAG: GAF domain-containing protein [Methylotenera sp.]|nr:GAF domain-containing protein [Oligoflexia bacterium]